MNFRGNVKYKIDKQENVKLKEDFIFENNQISNLASVTFFLLNSPFI